MVDHLVHEIAVVADDDDTAGEVLQVFLEDLQGDDVEVVGGLVEHEEVGVLHQHRAEVELAPLTAAELVDVVVLLLRGEEEVLEELRGGQVLSTAHVDVLGNVLHHIDHLLLLVELQTLLGEIAETHGIANVEPSAVGWHKTKEQSDERGLSRAVVAHDAHLLEAGEVIIEVLEDYLVVESLRYILALEDFAADIDITRLETHLTFLDALFGNTLQLIERLLTIASLMASGLRHAPHPLQFGAVEVVGSGNLRPTVVDALLALLEIVAIVAPIGVDRLVIEFEDDRADTVEEETVVGDHQQGLVAAVQEAFEPFDHLQVEVVGRLVEDQQVGLGNEHISQSHALLLSAAELSHRLREVADLQLGEDLLGF